MIQFAKHMKLKMKEDQSVDTLILLRREDKIPMEGVTETKFRAETEGMNVANWKCAYRYSVQEQCIGITRWGKCDRGPHC
jgi:hypothetical protein